MIFGLVQVSAEGLGQNVNYSAKNIPMEQVLKAIKKQSGYLFFYRTDDIAHAQLVTVQLKNASITNALNKIFEGQPLGYTIKANTVIVSARQIAAPATPEQIITNALIDIQGKVINENGQPMVVTIAVKGTSVATTSNADGDFKLFGVDENATLVITGVSIKPKEIKVDSRTNILIEVKNKISREDEVIVSTGYQNLRKSQLTGAYSTIDRNTYLQTVPTTGSIVENLEGRIAGLVLNVNQSYNNFAQPNNTSPFTIRGVSTFQAIKKPLIVLNGFPTEIDIASINPYDIESITVLKDAASAAIYGVRASNGVIVIVTKKGKAGRAVINFTTALTARSKPNFNKLNLLSGKGYLNFESAVANNDIDNNFISKDYLDASNGTYTPIFAITDDLKNGLITQAEADAMLEKYAAYDNTKDYKKLFLQNPFLQSYDLNVSGGGENSTYFFGLNHLNNTASDVKSRLQKTNINYRGSFKFNDRISADVQTIYSNNLNKSVPVLGFKSVQPYQRFLNDDGSPASTFFAKESYDYFGFGGSGGSLSQAQNQRNLKKGLYDQNYYPVQELRENSNNLQSDLYRVQGNVKAKITKELNFEVGGVFEKELSTLTSLASENAYDTRIMLNYFASPDFNGNPVFGIPQGGVKKTTANNINSYTLRAQLNYDNVFNIKHSLTLLGGAEQRKITNSGSVNTVFGYNNRTLSVQKADFTLLGNQNYFPGFYSDISPASSFGIYDQTEFGNPYVDENFTDDRFISYYGNVAYTYDRKYTFTGSLRLDQSNLFGTDPKFRYTPLWSAGLAWDLQKEAFLQHVTWLNALKYRIAGGYNGNIIKNSGPFNILRSQVNNYSPNPTIGYIINTPRNNRLRWEKTFNFNTGVDFSLLENSISGSVDYYIKRGKDIFNPIQVDPTTGFNNILSNNATIENRGVDVMLSTRNIANSKFTWQTQVTASFNRSEVLDVKNKFNGFYQFARAGGRENIVGHPLNSVLVFDYAGLNAKGQPQVRNEKGELVVVGFGKADIAFEALQFAGVNDPKYVIGLNNQFALGSFNLSALFMYYGGHVGLVAPPTVYDLRPTKEIANFWQKPGDEKTTDIPGFTNYSSPDYFNYTGYQAGGRFVEKFDYIALRDVTLTYNLKNNISNKIGLKNTKIILQVQNPTKFVFSGNNIDPETFDFVSGRRGLPVVPSYTFSFTTSF